MPASESRSQYSAEPKYEKGVSEVKRYAKLKKQSIVKKKMTGRGSFFAEIDGSGICMDTVLKKSVFQSVCLVSHQYSMLVNIHRTSMCVQCQKAQTKTDPPWICFLTSCRGILPESFPDGQLVASWLFRLPVSADSFIIQSLQNPESRELAMGFVRHCP